MLAGVLAPAPAARAADAAVAEPAWRVLDSTATTLRLELTIPGYERRAVGDAANPQAVALLVPGGGELGALGAPALPTVSHLVAVPAGVRVSGAVVDYHAVILDDLDLAPVTAGEGTPFTRDAAAYAIAGWQAPVFSATTATLLVLRRQGRPAGADGGRGRAGRDGRPGCGGADDRARALRRTGAPRCGLRSRRRRAAFRHRRCEGGECGAASAAALVRAAGAGAGAEPAAREDAAGRRRRARPVGGRGAQQHHAAVEAAAAHRLAQAAGLQRRSGGCRRRGQLDQRHQGGAAGDLRRPGAAAARVRGAGRRRRRHLRRADLERAALRLRRRGRPLLRHARRRRHPGRRARGPPLVLQFQPVPARRAS